MKKPIDFVVTWVDGNDDVWQKQKAAYTAGGSESYVGVTRYRDWGLMRYWFRGVERFAPWVNKVYFVTCGQTPKWLNTEHPKLKLVSHEEFMPASALPTFNSNAIELGIHRLEGLSEQFVLFNDDVFLINHIKPSMFFMNGLPCDYAALGMFYPGSEFQHVILNDLLLINENFSKKRCMRENARKWFSFRHPDDAFKNILLYFLGNQCFPAIMNYHNAIPYRKSEFEEMWERFPEKLNETVHHRFRCYEDYSHFLIRYWRLASGQFYPILPGYSVNTRIEGDNVSKIADMIAQQKKSEICINDHYTGRNFKKVRARLQQAFEQILPDPSSYEKG